MQGEWPFHNNPDAKHGKRILIAELSVCLIVLFGVIVVPVANTRSRSFPFGVTIMLLYAIPLVACFLAVRMDMGRKPYRFLFHSLMILPPVGLLEVLLHEYSIQTLSRDTDLLPYVDGSIARIVAGIVLWAMMCALCIAVMIANRKTK